MEKGLKRLPNSSQEASARSLEQAVNALTGPVVKIREDITEQVSLAIVQGDAVIE